MERSAHSQLVTARTRFLDRLPHHEFVHGTYMCRDALHASLTIQRLLIAARQAIVIPHLRSSRMRRDMGVGQRTVTFCDVVRNPQSTT